MKQTVAPGAVPDAWSAEALYNKALRYAEKMVACSSDSWDHALWSGLCLEFIARAALSNISPALLAETQTQRWSSLSDALGFPPTDSKYAPVSIGTTAVLARLRVLLPEFDKEMESFCAAHVGRRNEELHSGSLAYEGVGGAAWHGHYYRAVAVLLGSMGYELSDLIGEAEAAAAQEEITATVDESAKAVVGDVEAHQKVWEAKSDAERTALVAQADAWATRAAGHRVACPACGSPAIVVGEAIGAPQQELKGDQITEKQEHLPHWLQCIACGLKVIGLSKLQVIGLGDRYMNTSVYEAADYYAPADEYADFEDDNNEPF